MKKTILKLGILGLSLFGAFFVNVPPADAATCVFVRETENPLFAIYNCDGVEITVMRGATVQG